MKTKLTEDDSRLTAYALGELPRDEAEEIARILDEPLNGSLQRDVADIDSLGVMLSQTLNPSASEGSSFKLSPSQRDAIFRSAKAPTAADVISTHQSAWLRPTLVTLGAAALVAVSFIILHNTDGNKDGSMMTEASFSGLSDERLSAPIQPNDTEWSSSHKGSKSVSSQAGKHTAKAPSYDLSKNSVSVGDHSDKLLSLVENNWVNRADQAVTRLPLASGTASWNWVKSSINKKSKLPNRNAVRTEEILNAFSYNNPTDLELSLTCSGVELVRCPWDDKRMVAVVLVKNKHSENISIESAVTFGESVEKYRLVGYAKAKDSNKNIIAPAEITMGTGDSHLVMYEIETAADIKSAANVVTLSIRAEAHNDSTDNIEGDDETLNVQYSDRAWTKADQDIQFALILANWCRLIAADTSSTMSGASIITGMVAHFESNHTLSAKQRDAMKVIKKGLLMIAPVIE